MAGKVRRLALPFVVPAEDRKKAFSREMEMAAVFLLAERARKKGGGFLKRKMEGERLLFAARFCYPIWLIPWGEGSLLFDGLGASSHKLSYDTLPDIKAFINDIEASAKTREAYSAFLSDRLNFFKNFTGEQEKEIKGLVTDSKFLQDFSVYLKDATTLRKSFVDRALLSPALDESTISSIIQDLSSLRVTLEEDVKNLSRAMKLLSITTENQVKAIHDRIRETHREFEEKIANLRSSLTKRASQIRMRYDQEITVSTREIERKLRRLHKERVKLERTTQSTNAKIERCEAEIRSCRLDKDETGELRWREELETCRKKISMLEKGIKDLDKRIESATASKKQEISKLRSKRDERIEVTMKGVRDVEAARDVEIRMGEQVIESLEESTKTVVDQINALVGAKRAALDKLDGLGISKRIRKIALVYLPFYLLCYHEKLENRYAIISPSVAGSMGILTRFRGAFGAAKAKLLLQPRSKIIATLLNRLVPSIERNPVFEKETVDAGIKSNILRTKSLREKTRRGLEQLEEEKWISGSESRTFSKSLEKT
ncbi:MAG: hypothetical protein JSV57_05630 [Candidatus Bathyarchaeota archaeon]|nr:MAG: hypothetical protein JSV57_05630 [Candidatus Bathyarchaeota archaeon]